MYIIHLECDKNILQTAVHILYTTVITQNYVKLGCFPSTSLDWLADWSDNKSHFNLKQYGKYKAINQNLDYFEGFI
jgi:hypothetical protein